jgi:hypothetical protein
MTQATHFRGFLLLALAALACTGSGTGPAYPGSLAIVSGNNQTAPVGNVLQPYRVMVRDESGSPVSGANVQWQVTGGGGQIAPDSSLSDSSGVASAVATLGLTPGTQTVAAAFSGYRGSPVTFRSQGFTGVPFPVLGGGDNVPERYTSDLWIADGYAYTGTWYGPRITSGPVGNAVKIWSLSASGAPTLADSIIVPNIADVSDIEVSADGRWLVFTAEGGTAAGLYVYELTSPGVPEFRANSVVSAGLHTGTLAEIGGTLYAFTAKDPSSCALRIFNLSQATAGTITVASSTPIPDHYCIHDTFVRDGYAFVFAWNEGLYIFDVGNGSHGGTPAAPVQISKTGSPQAPAFGGETHNGWWFWNPTNGEKKYLFIGEEGPGSVGASSSGDIHVVDVSNLAAPTEVAHYHLAGAGTHNFWVDEPNQRLYAAYYNGGVVALDISGTLSGDLAAREITRIKPGGVGNTYVWGVMLYNGYLYASDMLSGLWQLGVP